MPTGNFKDNKYTAQNHSPTFKKIYASKEAHQTHQLQETEDKLQPPSKRRSKERPERIQEISKINKSGKTQILRWKELTTCKGGLCKKTIFRHTVVKFKNPREEEKVPNSFREKTTQISYDGTEVRVTDGDLRARRPGCELRPLFPSSGAPPHSASLSPSLG